jgi:hypothetical protein
MLKSLGHLARELQSVYHNQRTTRSQCNVKYSQVWQMTCSCSFWGSQRTSSSLPTAYTGSMSPSLQTTHTESMSPSLPTVRVYRYRLHIKKGTNPSLRTTHTESISPSYRLHIPKVSVHHTDHTYQKYQPIKPTTHIESMGTTTNIMHSLTWKSDPCTILLTYIPITVSNNQLCTSITESINKYQKWQTHTHTHRVVHVCLRSASPSRWTTQNVLQCFYVAARLVTSQHTKL